VRDGVSTAYLRSIYGVSKAYRQRIYDVYMASGAPLRTPYLYASPSVYGRACIPIAHMCRILEMAFLADVYLRSV
jgi:hypothetical protein